jgi:hypothetical protein
MIPTLAATPQARRAYDHRLREHVFRAGVRALTNHLPIPRSTVSTWQRRGLRPVVTSMIEAWWRSLKHQWLYLNALDAIERLRTLVGFFVEQHNSAMPHSAFHGRPPTKCISARRATSSPTSPTPGSKRAKPAFLRTERRLAADVPVSKLPSPYRRFPHDFQCVAIAYRKVWNVLVRSTVLGDAHAAPHELEGSRRDHQDRRNRPTASHARRTLSSDSISEKRT